MNMQMQLHAAALLMAALAPLAGAQTPPRDTAKPATGTARISGRVIAADTGAPLPRAHVSVYGSDADVRRDMTTGQDGRYEATNMPAGRYNLSVSLVGYVTLQFGQTRALESGTQLDLARGQMLDGIDFALSRGAVIAGRIIDQNGVPLAGVEVRPMRYVYQSTGTRLLQAVSSGRSMMSGYTTDDRGQFRIYGLAPGSYVVAAGALPGGISHVGNASFGPTYYPGTANRNEAQAVTVGLAETVEANFMLVPSRLARVSGVVVDSRGRPVARRTVMLMFRSDSMTSTRSVGATLSDGRFQIDDLAPGDYAIEVTPSTAAGTEPADEPEFASVPISVKDQDVAGLVITTHSGATVTGRVVFEGTSLRPGARQLVVTPVSATSGAGRSYGRSINNSGVDAEGNFRITGVTGSVLFEPSLLTRGELWALKSVRLNGADITDVGYDVTTNVDGLEVVLTDRQTTVSGIAKDSRGQPVRRYAAVILPRELKPGALPTRFVRTASPDQQGRYHTKGLPPGAYVAAAVEFLEPGGHYDPALQKRIRASGAAFTLKEEQSLALDLQLIP